MSSKFKSYFFIVITILSFLSQSYAYDEPLSVKDVISSTFKHHPAILAQLQEFVQAQQELRQSLGAFDLTLKSNAEGYTDGYYDGRAFSIFLEKPLFYMNSKAYAGYRKSDGDLPIYSQDLVTEDQGEVFAGVMISLLRDRGIDEKRFKNLLAKQDLVQSEIALEQQYIELQTMAAEAYYKWLIDLEKLRIQKELLGLAESRIQSFNTRIKKGDLAKIYGVENEQYILKRKYELNGQEQKLYVSALYLSLFFRDENGTPIILKSANGSKVGDFKKQKVKPEAELLHVVNSKDLTIKALQSQLVQTDAYRRMGDNDLLPKLDVKYQISEDRGDGAANLDPLEQKAYINLEIPIERRLGLGRKQAAKAKQESLEFKIRFRKEKNRTEVLALLNNLRLFESNFELTKKEIELASKLREAELAKFNKGASDFILVNLREENLAESKIKNATAYLDYNLNFINLQKLAVDFIVKIP